MRFLIPFRLLIIAVAIATSLRFWQLGTIPPSLDWDEAALGYNAYSILKTGRDEYGTWFPRVLRSFDDYKPPIYAYLAIPPIALFGLEPWVVRLPSAVMGIFAVVGVYVLVKKLIEYSGFSHTSEFLQMLPGISSMLLAISPWHIQFSRIAFEANIGVTINIWAVISFLYGLTSSRWLAVSAFLFGLGLYAYHSERIFVPLLVLLLAVVFRNDLRRHKKQVFLAVLVGMITVAPLIPVFTSQTTLMRLRGTSSLADQTGLLARSVTKLEYDRERGNPWGILFDNRRIVWAKTLIEGYLSHYSLRWLFLTGDNARHHAPDIGLLYLWELPFLIGGLYIVGRKGGKMGKILLGWFLIAPVAAAPTTELPHAIRTLVFLPTFQIFTAVGIIAALSNNIHNKYQKLSAYGTGALIILFLIFNISYYLHLYFGHTNHEYSKFWQYGFKEAVAYASAHKNEYRNIVVSTKLEQPHMFFLFYLKYDPVKYLEEGGTRSGGFAEEGNRFDVYEFRPIQWEKEVRDGSILYIGTPQEISSSGLLTIKYLDGTDAIKIATN